MNIYPNPANDRVAINLDLKIGANYSLSVTNLLGQRVSAFDLDLEKGSSKLNLDVSKYEPGIYLITVQSNQSAITKKLVIE